MLDNPSSGASNNAAIAAQINTLNTFKLFNDSAHPSLEQNQTNAFNPAQKAHKTPSTEMNRSAFRRRPFSGDMRAVIASAGVPLKDAGQWTCKCFRAWMSRCPHATEYEISTRTTARSSPRPIIIAC